MKGHGLIAFGLLLIVGALCLSLAGCDSEPSATGAYRPAPEDQGKPNSTFPQ